MILLAFSVVFWLGADGIPKSRLSGSVGADGLPKMLAVTLGILSAGLIAQTLLMMKLASPTARAGEGDKSGHWMQHLRALGMIALGAAYLVLVPYLGYVLSIGLLLLAVALYNGKRPSAGLFLFAALGAVFFAPDRLNAGARGRLPLRVTMER
jgi:putative tricarboxylic transport membrane protein